MSFFLGKDSSDKPLLHMSAGTRSAEELKTGEYSDTIFHSSREYIQYTAYNNVSFKHISNNDDAGVYHIYYGFPGLTDYLPTKLSVPRSVYTAALQGKGILLRVHLTNTSYVAVPFISYRDVSGTLPANLQSRQEGSVVWYDSTAPAASLVTFSPAPLLLMYMYDIATMLPVESLVSVDVLVLDWGSGYTFSPNKPSEIRITDNDIQLGSSTSNRLSRYQYIRISGTQPIDSANKRLRIFDIKGQKTIGYMEFMNEPIPTGNTIELSPTRLVVKGRTQVDKNKAAKTPKYKASGSVTVPTTDTGTTNPEAVTEVVIMPKNTYKSTDLIHIYIGYPSGWVEDTPVGSYGPFLMGDNKTVDAHLFGNEWISLSTALKIISVGPRANGDYVIKVQALAPQGVSRSRILGFSLSYLIFPEI